jgi:hypothetical protein
MKKRNIVITMTLILLAATLLTACGSVAPTEDANVKFTEIASTVQAQLTQNALLTPSATPTLEATATPTLEPATATPTGPTPTPVTPTPTIVVSSGENSKFIADVTIPDGTQFKPGTGFTKTWRIQNIGSTTWTTQYKLVYVDGVTGANNTLSVPLPKEVKPGESIEISVKFLAPSSLGSYTSWWRMLNANGAVFGDPFSVVFTVGSSNATVAVTSTAASTSAVTATPTTEATTAATATTTP